MTEWGQYDPIHLFDDFKIKQSTTEIKIDIHKMIDLTFNIKINRSVVIKKKSELFII